MNARTALAALIVPLALLTPGSAVANEGKRPTGDLHAYASQSTSCADPGFIGINYAEGVEWTLEGEPVTVTPPSTRFEFPAGVQAEVRAHALDGYAIRPEQTSTFYLQVNPCVAEKPAPSCVEQERKIKRQAERLARKSATIKRLRAALRSR